MAVLAREAAELVQEMATCDADQLLAYNVS